MRNFWKGCAVAVTAGLGLTAVPAAASAVFVIGGQTSVALDTEVLGLTLTGVSDEVIDPGAIPGSVAFLINPRNHPTRPTTLAYDATDPVASVTGALEHTGSLTFNDGIVVGNFSIAVTSTIFESGAEVVDNIGSLGTLFFAAGDADESIATGDELRVVGDLIVTASFADTLEALGLIDDAAAVLGADVGDFEIDATVVPLPGAAVLLGTGFVALAGVRRRRKKDGDAGGQGRSCRTGMAGG